MGSSELSGSNGCTTWRVWAAGAALVLAANAPIVLWAATFYGRGAGDARTHARVAASIAAHGLSHGWTDAYGGGFPLGPHYPITGWALSVLLIKVGLSPMVAVGAIGLLALLAAPLAALFVALRCGARPIAAVACALFLSWVAPGDYFVGGYETFFGLGLLSQVVAIPCLVFLFGAIASKGPPWHATLAAVLAVVSHPQVATAGMVVLFASVLLSQDGSALTRFARAGLAFGVVGAALYGPGIATLRVPFGWPPMESWRTIGFDAGHLEPWLFGGQLLDVGRFPILTLLWGVSILVLMTRLWKPLARAAVGASVVTLAISVSGGVFESLGRIGAFLLSFLQPLRVLALVPLVASATVLVAVEQITPVFAALFHRAPASFAPDAVRSASTLPSRAARWAPPLIAALVAVLALPTRFAVAKMVRRKVSVILESFRGGDACDPPGDKDNPSDGVAAWVSSLSAGRLWYDDTRASGVECEFATGFETLASVPIAVTSGVGGHVGVHQVAFHALAPTSEGSAMRAEALGIRHVLLFDGEKAGDGWKTVHESGPVSLADRIGGTDVVGVGCISAVWEGSNAALREHLFAQLSKAHGRDELLDPRALVALEIHDGDWTAHSRDRAGCDTEGAKVTERPRAPGALEADIDSPAPVDVVLRVTAFPAWRILVDGNEEIAATVAPGFPSVRISRGNHHIEAVVGFLPGYLLTLTLALVGAIFCSLPLPRFARGRLKATDP